MGWGAERMKNKRYILLLSAFIWMIIVWIPFNQRHSLALFLSALYCTVATTLICLSIAGDYGARRRKLEEQRTEERYMKIAEALERAQTDPQNKLRVQSYSEANRRWKVEKASNFETSGRYEDAARMYDVLEMHDKAIKCRKMAKTTYP
jgi:hypothetical protein